MHLSQGKVRHLELVVMRGGNKIHLNGLIWVL